MMPAATSPTSATSAPSAASSAAPSRRSPSPWAVLRVEVRDELLVILREPTALFFSVLMPVLFFALFVALFGGQRPAGGGLPVGTTMLATFGTYGVVAATLMSPGVTLADARERGWLRVLKTSPTPVPLTLAAKVIATLPLCLGILTAMTLTAAALGVLEITVLQWSALCAVLVIGTVPFALVGLAVGALASPNATTAVLNALVIPMAIASGLWFPLSIMPEWVGRVAVLLPTYHLSALALGVLELGVLELGVLEAGVLEGGAGWAGHLLGLLAFAALAAAAAALAYRRSPI